MHPRLVPYVVLTDSNQKQTHAPTRTHPYADMHAYTQTRSRDIIKLLPQNIVILIIYTIVFAGFMWVMEVCKSF